MFDMDERFFRMLQRECCWFTVPMPGSLPDVDPSIEVTDQSIWNDDIRFQRRVFAMIFGSFGCSVELSKAEVFTMLKLRQVETQEPENKSTDNPEYLKWLGRFAQYNILLAEIIVTQNWWN